MSCSSLSAASSSAVFAQRRKRRTGLQARSKFGRAWRLDLRKQERLNLRRERPNHDHHTFSHLPATHPVAWARRFDGSALAGIAVLRCGIGNQRRRSTADAHARHLHRHGLPLESLVGQGGGRRDGTRAVPEAARAMEGAGSSTACRRGTCSAAHRCRRPKSTRASVSTK